MPRQPYIPFENSVYRPLEHPISLHGVAPDLPPDMIGNEFLASAMNMLIRNGRVVSRKGIARLYQDAATAPMRQFMEFTSTRAPASAMIVGATTSKFYYYHPATVTWNDITTTARTGGTLFPIFFCTYLTGSVGHRVVSVNGVDPPAWWSGATNTAFVVLSTAVIGACVAPWRSHLLLGDTTDSVDGHITTRVHWCALGDPNTWSGTASAGSIDLTSFNSSKIMNMVPFRNFLGVYKEQGVHALVYKASPFYFTQQELHPTLSLLCRRGVCAIDNGERHAVITQEGMVLWDGQTVRAIGKDRVDRTILSNIDWASRETAFVHWWAFDREVIFVFPDIAGGGAYQTWIYNLDYDAWWETDMNLSALCSLGVTAQTPTLMGARVVTGHTYSLYTGYADDLATNITSSFQTAAYDYGAFELKRLTRVDALFAPQDAATVVALALSYGIQENPAQPVQILPTTSTNLVTSYTAKPLPHVDWGFSNRFVSFRGSFSDNDNGFAIRSLISRVTERGNKDLI